MINNNGEECSDRLEYKIISKKLGLNKQEVFPFFKIRYLISEKITERHPDVGMCKQPVETTDKLLHCVVGVYY